MYSAHNEIKSVLAERFIKTSKANIFKKNKSVLAERFIKTSKANIFKKNGS